MHPGLGAALGLQAERVLSGGSVVGGSKDLDCDLVFETPSWRRLSAVFQDSTAGHD